MPSPFAVRSLRFAFDARQRSKGLESWQAPAVYAWPQFLASLWSSLILSGHEDRILLNAAQEHLLWQSVIGGAKPASSLTSADSLAELAAGAFRLAADYEALGQLRATANSTDARTFADWAALFQKRCDAEACLPAALLQAALADHAAVLVLPTELHLAGFTNFTPAQLRLLGAMRARGIAIPSHQLKADTASSPRALLASSLHTELQVAAKIISMAARENPGVRFAILLPDVAADRGELESVLRNTLAAALSDIATPVDAAPWSFASGSTVSNHPLAAAAMNILHLLIGPLSLERISALLLSPYIGQNEARDAAARLDAELRRKHVALRPELNLAALVQRVARMPAEDSISWPSNLSLHLQRSEPDLTRSLTQPRAYAAWSELAREALRAVAWPGPRVLLGTEATAMEAFDATLDLLATLDFAGRRIPFRTWLSTLVWQLEHASGMTAPAAAPVQILSLAESAGTVFDHALLLRATDANWPAGPRPHPLLSFALQRTLGMPGADFEHDRELASADARDLLARCSNITITCAAEDKDGPLRPSPLIAELGIVMGMAALAASSTETTALEYVADDAPLPPPATSVRGGAKVLQLQAACGFRAFAELRLLATEPDSASLGLDAAEAGNLLHRTLQTFWKVVPSRDALQALSHEERQTHLDQAIADAIAERRLHAGNDWDTAYLDVQRRRLRHLLLAWLDHELERGPFQVLDTEAMQDVTVGPLTLSVRLDRMDAVEDSTGPGVFFVDYKTGVSVTPNQWDGERPDDPQLPLYALLPEASELKGLAFARIRAGKDMRWHGYQTELGILPGTRGNSVKDLESTVEEWRFALTQLAQAFYEGRTDVRPKSIALNCRYCGQRLLCRLDPASLMANTESESDTTEAAASE